MDMFRLPGNEIEVGGVFRNQAGFVLSPPQKKLLAANSMT